MDSSVEEYVVTRKGRGRPKGSKNKKTLERERLARLQEDPEELELVSEAAVEESQEGESEKRGPGRPKKEVGRQKITVTMM
ncbi:hypothetical protein V5O48_019386, partial [Marasmius crinis-equi]